MADHLTFLEHHADQIQAAGPLRDDQGAGRGGLWVVEADDIATVDHLVRADPFWPTGLRQSVEILTWAQVFAAGRRLIQPN